MASFEVKLSTIRLWMDQKKKDVRNLRQPLAIWSTLNRSWLGVTATTFPWKSWSLLRTDAYVLKPASLLLSKSLLGASTFLSTSISVNYPLLEQCGLSIWNHSSINTEGHQASAKVRSIQRLGASRRCHAYSQRDMVERTSEENDWIRWYCGPGETQKTKMFRSLN